MLALQLRLLLPQLLLLLALALLLAVQLLRLARRDLAAEAGRCVIAQRRDRQTRLELLDLVLQRVDHLAHEGDLLVLRRQLQGRGLRELLDRGLEIVFK